MEGEKVFEREKPSLNRNGANFVDSIDAVEIRENGDGDGELRHH